MHDVCTTCGKAYRDCRYPLSHAHATVENVKLPARISRALSRGDKAVLNQIEIFPPDFPHQVDEVF